MTCRLDIAGNGLSKLFLTIAAAFAALWRGPRRRSQRPEPGPTEAAISARILVAPKLVLREQLHIAAEYAAIGREGKGIDDAAMV